MSSPSIYLKIEFEMECITLLRKHLTVIGIQNIFEKSPQCRLRAYNSKNTMICILAGCNAILYARLLYEPNTFEELTNVIYNCSSATVFTLIFLVIIWKTLDLYAFIDKLERTVKNRKCCTDCIFELLNSHCSI